MFFIKGLLDLEDPLVLLLKQITNGFPRKFSSLPQVFPQTILVQLLSSQNFLEIHSILQNILKVEKRSLIHFKFLYFHRVTLHWKNLKLINIQKNQFYGKQRNYATETICTFPCETVRKLHPWTSWCCCFAEFFLMVPSLM